MDESGLTGDELRAFRDRLGISSRDFSRALKLPELDGSRVRGWERGADRRVPIYVTTLVEMVDQVPAAREWFLQRAFNPGPKRPSRVDRRPFGPKAELSAGE